MDGLEVIHSAMETDTRPFNGDTSPTCMEHEQSPTQDDFLTIVPRPTLLGKEKAKRRLKAFSLIKHNAQIFKKMRLFEVIPNEVEVNVQSPRDQEPQQQPEPPPTGTHVEDVASQSSISKEDEQPDLPNHVNEPKHSPTPDAKRTPKETSKDVEKTTTDHHVSKQAERPRRRSFVDDVARYERRFRAPRAALRKNVRKSTERRKTWNNVRRGVVRNDHPEESAGNEMRKNLDVLPSNNFDYRKMLLFPTLKECIKPFAYKTDTGAVMTISAQYVRFTQQSTPQITYSPNGNNATKAYCQRKEIFSVIEKEQRECFMSLLSHIGDTRRHTSPQKAIAERSWYPRHGFFLAESEDRKTEPSSSVEKGGKEENGRRRSNARSPRSRKNKAKKEGRGRRARTSSRHHEEKKAFKFKRPSRERRSSHTLIDAKPNRPKEAKPMPAQTVVNESGGTPESNEQESNEGSPAHRSLSSLIASYCKAPDNDSAATAESVPEPATPTKSETECVDANVQLALVENYYTDPDENTTEISCEGSVNELPPLLQPDDTLNDNNASGQPDEIAADPETETIISILADICSPIKISDMPMEKLKTKPSELYSPTLQSSDSSDSNDFPKTWDTNNAVDAAVDDNANTDNVEEVEEGEVVGEDVVVEDDSLTQSTEEEKKMNNCWESDEENYVAVERVVVKPKEITERSLEMPLNISISRPRLGKMFMVPEPHVRTTFLFEDLDGNCSWDSDLKNTFDLNADLATDIQHMKQILKGTYSSSVTSTSSSSSSSSSESTSSSNEAADCATSPLPRSEASERKPLAAIVITKKNPLIGCSLFKDDEFSEDDEAVDAKSEKIEETAALKESPMIDAPNARGPFTPPITSRKWAESASPRRDSSAHGSSPRRRFSPSMKRYSPKRNRNKGKRMTPPRRTKDSPVVADGVRSPTKRRECERKTSPRGRDLSPRRRDRSPKGKDMSPRHDGGRHRERSPKFRERSPHRTNIDLPRHRDYDRDRHRDTDRHRDRKFRDESPRYRDSPNRYSPPSRRRSPTRFRYSPKRDRSSPRYRSRSPRRRTRSKTPPRRVYSGRSRSVDRKQESIAQTLHRLAGIDYETPNSPSMLTDRFSIYAPTSISDAQMNEYNASLDSPIFFHPPFTDGSPKRIPLDDRINQVLGLEAPKGGAPVYPSPNDPHMNGYYQSGYYDVGYNKAYEPSRRRYRPHSNGDGGAPSTKVVQVGNVLQVVPTEQGASPRKPPKGIIPVNGITPTVAQKFVPVGNMVQIVPTTVIPTELDVPPVLETDKVNAEVNQPDMAATKVQRQAEKDARRLEREQRRKEKETRRKARDRRRLMKLKAKSEAMIKKAMLLDKVNDDADDEGDTKLPTVSIVALPGAKPARGILRKQKDDKENGEPCILAMKKSVTFADGVMPGEGTSPSAGEDLSSPPPFQKLPREKRLIKTKKASSKHSKKKIKVKIVKPPKKQEVSDDEDEDTLEPPSPPPGSPPPHVFPPRLKYIYHTNFYPAPFIDSTNCRRITDTPHLPYPNFPPMPTAAQPQLARLTFPPPTLSVPPAIAGILPLRMPTVRTK